MRFLILFLAVGFLMNSSELMAAELPPNFVQKVHKNANGTESPYVVYVPAGHDKSKPLPVVLFLHGAGESKGGAKMPHEQGLCNGHLQKQIKRFPCIVVVPQAEEKNAILGRWHPEALDGKRAIAMLDATIAEYNGDTKRQYLTGLSMGGFGTWAMAAAYPDRWACIVPICGGGKPEDAEKIKDIPCWALHGGADAVVKPELSRVMIEAIKKAGGHPRYTEMAHVGHNSWDPAYAIDELYSWMFSQKKK
ncbi:MAG: alpha/beta hydrolase-fold protein [Fimbriiglobus sp.]